MKFSVETGYRLPIVVRHQGVVIVFALDESRDIYYRVLALDPDQPDDDKGWGNRRKIAFPDQLRPAGMSLVTVDINTAERTVAAPFQAVSDGKHVYLFRQSIDGTLYVDRFVFDPARQTLNPAWEARFQRSRKRDVPASRKDSMGARDMEGEPFFEPTTELTVVNGVHKGRFCVLLLPGRLPSEWRWQIFATNIAGQIDSFSIGRGEDGLFDMADVQQSCLKWADPEQRFQTGPAALLYMQQEEAQDEYGRTQRLKRAARVMLAAPAGTSEPPGSADDGPAAVYPIAILDFGVSRAGTLALIGGADVPSEVTLSLRGDDFAGLLGIPAMDADAAERALPMHTVAVDDRGLTVSAGLLKFARSGDTPFLLDGADGLVHLYFRGDDDQLLVAQHDTLTARAEYALPLGGGGSKDGEPHLHFTALRPGTMMQDYQMAITDGDDGKSCQVTIGNDKGAREIWQNVPRDLESFLAVLNGAATRDADDPLVQEGELVWYEYSRCVQRVGVPDLTSADTPYFGSTLFALGVENLPDTGLALKVPNLDAAGVAREPRDCAWIPEPQDKALQFDGTDDHVELPNDRLVAAGDLTMEAWVNVGDGAGTADSLRIVDFHRSEDERCTLGLARDEVGGDDEETLYKVFAGVWNQAVQTQDATVRRGEWTHLAAVHNATSALSLDGQGHVDCGNDATLDMTEAMTVEAWVTMAPEGDSSESQQPEARLSRQPQVILSKWGAAAEDQSWRLYVDTDNRPCFETLDHNRRPTRVKSSKPLQAGRAYHLAGVYAASPKKEAALSLKGPSEHVSIPSADAINFGAEEEFTVAAWIKPAALQKDETHADNAIIEKWSGSVGYPYVIRYLNQQDEDHCGKVWVARFDGFDTHNNPWIRSKVRINDGAFHHVVFVKRGSQLALYVDGFLQGTAPDTTREDTTNDGPLFIGARGGKTNFFSGQVNRVRIWNHPLSIEDIRKDMETPTSQVADAVGHWAFDELDKVLDKAQERSRFAKDGALVGGIIDDTVDMCEYAQKIYVDGELGGWGLIAADRHIGWLGYESGATMSLEVLPLLSVEIGDVLLLQDRQVVAREVDVVTPEPEDEDTIDFVPTVEVAAATINGWAKEHPRLTRVYRLKRGANTMQSTTTKVHIGRSASDAGFQGTIDDVRVWKVSRSAWQIRHYRDESLPGNAAGLVSHWRFEEGRGETALDSKGSNHGHVIHPIEEEIPGMWVPSARRAALSLYVNGQGVDVSYGVDVDFGDPQFSLGAMLADGTSQQHMAGIIDELRLWKEVRTREQIRDSMYRSLSGTEENLAGYWPLDEGEGMTVGDLTGNGQNGTLAGPQWIDSTAPISNEGPEVRNVYGGLAKPEFNPQILGSPAAVEYGDVQWDAEGNLFGVMKRCYLFQETGSGVVQLITGFKIGDLETNYVGQVQTAPTLIGYIEGAPPVPSENLTVHDADYADASAIQLTEAKETTQVYSASRDAGFDMSVDVKAGLYFTTETGTSAFGIHQKLLAAESKIGLHAYFEYALGWLSDASVSAGASRTLTKSLALRGDWEEPQDHDRDGQPRYLNPEVGRRYLPNNMGYALVKSGTADLFALRLKRTGSLVAYQLLPNPDIPEDWNIIMFPLNPRYVKNGTLDGMVGLVADPDFPRAAVGERGSYFRPLEAYALKERIERETKKIAGYYETFDVGKLARRGQLGIGSLSDRLPEQELGYDWETGRDKRNMVNTYVWTADGGFYAEEEQVSSVRQESRGGSFHFLGQLGFVTDLKFALGPGFFLEVDALFGGHLDVTASQSKEESAAFGLTVDVQGEGFLNKWAGDPDGKGGSYTGEPCPGKVDAYRFMTFYLAPKPESFYRFFDEVVDPEWLNGQGRYAGEYNPNARALREARHRPNELWRVMHRVTYVSRVPPQVEPTPVETVPKDVRQPANIEANIALIQAIKPLVSPKPDLATLGRAVDQLLIGDGDEQGELQETVSWWAQVPTEIKREIRQDALTYLKGYHEIDPAQPDWQLALEYRRGVPIIAGSLPRAGIQLTVTDPWGNASTVTSGTKLEYGPGGFEVSAPRPVTYTLIFLDQAFLVQMKEGMAAIVTMTEE